MFQDIRIEPVKTNNIDTDTSVKKPVSSSTVPNYFGSKYVGLPSCLFIASMS